MHRSWAYGTLQNPLAAVIVRSRAYLNLTETREMPLISSTCYNVVLIICTVLYDVNPKKACKVTVILADISSTSKTELVSA